MKLKGQTPLVLFREYKLKTEQGLNEYNRFMWVAPLEHVKDIERQVWKDGVLAEIYGRIASVRDGIDHIQNWREGK